MTKNKIVLAGRALLLGAFLILTACGKEYTDIEHLERAKNFQDAQELSSAIIELKGALNKNPQNTEARWLLGLAYLEKKDGESAEKELQRAQELGMASDVIAPKLTTALFYQGKYSEMLNEALYTDIGNMSAADKAELLALKGRALAGLGKKANAQEYFDKALETAPQNNQAFLGLASLAVSARSYELADQHLKQVFKTDATNMEALIMKGSIMLKRSDFQGAKDTYQSLRAAHPKNLKGRLGLAEAEFSLGNDNKALKGLEPVLKTRPNMPEANFLQARIHFKQKNYDLAAESLQKVLKALPGDLKSHLMMGAIHYSKGNFNSARTHLFRYVDRATADAEAFSLYGATLMYLGEHAEAIPFLEKSDKIAPNNPKTLTLLARAFEHKGDLIASRAYYSQAAQITDDAALYNEIAINSLNDGKPQDAIQQLKTALNNDPKNLEADILLATAYVREGNTDKALQTAKDFIGKHPDESLGYKLLAAIYLSTNDMGTAKESLNKALEINPQDTESITNMAGIMLREGNLSGAKDHFEKVLSYIPNQATALLGLSGIAALENKPEKATALIEQAWQHNPSHIQAGLALINIHRNKANHLKVISIAQELHENNPDNALALKTLGMAHLANGEPARALSDFESLARLIPNTAESHFYLAQAHLRLGHGVRAENELKQALAINEKFLPAITLKAKMLFGSQRFEEAVNLAKTTQKHYPKMPTGYHMEGDAMSSSGDYLQAAMAYSKAFQKAPNEARAILSADHFLRAGDNTRAITNLADWLGKNPASHKARFAYAAALQQSNKLDKASQQYLQILEAQPDNLVAMNNLAWLYHEQGDTRALDYAEKAYELNREQPALLDTLGWLLVQNNQVERGVQLLQKAAQRAPKNDEIRKHLEAANKKAAQTK